MRFYDYVLRFKDQASSTIDRVRRAARGAGSDASQAGSGMRRLEAGARGAAGGTDQARDSLGRFVAGAKKGESAAGGMRSAFGGLKGMLAGVLTVATLLSFAHGVVDTTAKFETMGAVLTNTLGSKSAAQKSMAMITDFAAKTPFAVDELTDSYVKLANRGFQPTMDQMTRLGDIASSQGKGFGQFTEALLDAQTGEFERLKEFGITAHKAGEKVTFMFKNQQTTIANNSKAIQDYLLKVGGMKGVAGTMGQISQTLGGQISNLGDQFDSLKLKIGTSTGGAMRFIIGMASKVLTVLGGVVDWLNRRSAQIRQAFAPLGDAVRPLLDTFKELWAQLYGTNDLSSVLTGVFNGLATAINYLAPPLKIAAGLLADVWRFQARVQVAIGNFLATSPRLQKFFAGLWEGAVATFKAIAAAIGKYLGGAATFIEGVFSGNLSKMGEGLKQTFAALGDTQSVGLKAAAGFKDGWDKGFQKSTIFSVEPKTGAKGLLDKADGKKAADALGASPEVKAGIDKVSNTDHIRNVTVNIGKFQDSVNIHTQTLGESAGQVVDTLQEWMVRAVAGAELALG